MRLWRQRRDSQKTPGTTAQPSSDIYEFQEAVKAALKRSGGKLAIYRRQTSGGKPAYQREMSLQEAAGADSFLTYLHSVCGDGEFVVQLLQASGKLSREFIFALGKVKPLRAPADDSSRPSSTTQFVEGMKLVAEIMKPQQQGNGNLLETIKAIGELNKEGKEFQTEIMAVLLNNALGSGQTSDLDNAMKLLEFTKQMQPHVEQQDGLTGLLQSIVAPLIAGSMGGGANPLAALAQLQQSGAKPTPPGTSQGPAALATSPPVQTPGGGMPDHRVVFQTQEAPPPGSAPVDPHQAFYNMAVLPFRQAVAAGATPEQLGTIIMGIVQTAKQWQSQNPHPMVAQLVRATTSAELNAGFDTFCSAIPEINQKTALQGEIKAYLISVLSQAYQAQQAEEAQVVGEDATASFAGTGEEDREGEEDVYGPDDGEQPDTEEQPEQDRPDGEGAGTGQQDANDPSQVG